jgi:GMP synthase-like glutamine amidotransferase
MKLGILKTDTVLPELAEQFGEYPEMFARLLDLDPTLELVSFDVINGEYPADIDDVDAYLITGSKTSVYDDEDWIKPLMSFVRELDFAKKKLVGICFGHQLIAQALGGKTSKSDQGWCVGIHTATLNQKAQRFGSAGESFKLLSSHQDQVEHLADGAKILASTANCAAAMTSLGDHILTFQGHPEFDKEYARQLLDMRREILGESIYTAAIASLQQETDHHLAARWIIDFIQ